MPQNIDPNARYIHIDTSRQEHELAQAIEEAKRNIADIGSSLDLDTLIALKNQTTEPVTVTHIGSTSKCKDRFAEMQLKDTIANKMVYTIGCNTKSDGDLMAMGTTIDKTGLDILHLWKIDKSQEVLVLDITDAGERYIGTSTARELEYARWLDKRIRFYSQEQ